MHYKNEEVPVKIEKKQVVFLMPNDGHAMEALNDNAAHVNISITKRLFFEISSVFIVENYPDFFKTNTITLEDGEFSDFLKRLGELMQIKNENTTLRENMLRSIVLDLFFRFVKKERAENKIPDWLVNFVSTVCSADFYQYRLSELYKYSNYSQPVLSKEFKKYYGQPFVQFFTKKKMEYACNLLERSNLSVLEISNRLGFSSVSHFNALFKKFYGITPTEHRNAERDVERE